ncbi:chitinase domain-containing protein 1 [Sergentomyia squamirostris]
MKIELSVLIVLSVLPAVFCTLTPSKKGQKGTKNPYDQLKVKEGPVDTERDLVRKDPTIKEILVENAAYFINTSLRNFENHVVGFVTPWNNHGYDVAKIFTNKFDVISPVWLQIHRQGKQEYRITGTHDVNEGWMNELKKNSLQRVKIVPRVIFDKFEDDDFAKLLTFREERQVIAKLLIQTCDIYKFDGILLDVWSQITLRVDDPYLFEFIEDIAKPMVERDLLVYMAVPPRRKHLHDHFTPAHFTHLWKFISGFTVMTYDYSNIRNPGPNAPYQWVRDSIEFICPNTTKNYMQKRKKILLGLNMYGLDFTPDGGGAIIGHEYLRLLRHVKGRLALDENDEEHYFDVKTPTGRHIVFYPSLYSIKKRIDLAREMGTGLSLWELGQGLDYFYDLL